MEGSQEDYAVKPKLCVPPHVCKPTLTPLSPSEGLEDDTQKEKQNRKQTQKQRGNVNKEKEEKRKGIQIKKDVIKKPKQNTNSTTTAILDMYIFHPKEYYNISGQNTADVLGDIQFICGDYLANHTR